MSWQATTAVVEHSKARGSDYTVLLMLANHAHADGTNAHPSTETLAREARVSVRTVQGALKRLQALGEVVCVPNGGPRGVNRYAILLPIRGVVPADAAPPQMLRPRKMRQDPPQNLPDSPQSTANTPADSAPEPELTVIEQSGNSQMGRAREPKPVPKPAPTEAAPRHRLPGGWQPTPEMLDKAGRKYHGVNLEAETDRFRLHHELEGTQHSRWDLAWWKWLASPYPKVMLSSDRAIVPAAGNSRASPPIPPSKTALKARQAVREVYGYGGDIGDDGG